MSPRSPALLAVLAVVALCAAPAAGQQGDAPAERRTGLAVRIDPEQAPAVDGDVGDPIWASVEPIGELRQREPIEGAEASERTVVRIAHDGTTLFFALECYDSDPSGIRATQRRRDADLDPDDRIELVLDTQRDRRNAYFLQISPAGSYGDALISGNGRRFDKSWDGLWFGRARITDEGWFAELSVPMRTLATSPDVSTWGFNIKRFIRRKREELLWANPRLDSSLFRIRDAGDLAGLSDLQQGVGLDVVPYVKLTADRDREAADDDLLGTGGGELFYRLTPGITGALTVNTDFAETEVDERIVNLSRFPRFFPEKRQFFLEDAGIFSFETGGGGFGGSNDLLPYFSRRIGLDDDGQEIPIDVGLKVSGFEGPWSLGVLSVRTGAEGDVDDQELFVTRVRRNLDTHHTLGGIVTHGNPTENLDNTVVGFDYRYSTSSFLGDRNLDVTVFGLASDTDGEVGRDEAFGAEVDYPNDRWDARLRAREIGQDFNPELGFVEREGIRQYDGELAFRPRLNTAIRQLNFRWRPDYITDLDGNISTSDQRFTFGVEMESGDEASISVKPSFDKVEEDFEIVDGIVVPADRYSQTRWELELESAEKRPLVARFEIEGGPFNDGDRTDVEAGLDWRPGGFFQLGLGYEINDLDLPGGETTVRIASVRTEMNWSPELSWQNLLQYDNVSERIGLNSRVRWTLEPGDDMFLVLNQGWDREDDDSIVPERTDLTLKLVRTIRF
jgi:hypothetical protein